MGQAAAALAQLMGFDAQRLVKRHRLHILDRHFRSHSHNLTKLAEFAHGVVEDGGDNAAMAVSGWAGVALAEPEAAYESISFLSELKAHPLWVVWSAIEVVVLV